MRFILRNHYTTYISFSGDFNADYVELKRNGKTWRQKIINGGVFIKKGDPIEMTLIEKKICDQKN